MTSSASFTAFFLLLALDAGFAATQPAISPSLTLQAAEARDQDDLTFWLHPSDLSQSTIITSDKKANKIFVYDLAGTTLQVVSAQKPGNIDTRYGFTLAKETVDIVAFNERGTNKIRVYKVNVVSRHLEQIDDGKIDSGPSYGVTLYRSPKTGRFYAFTSTESTLWSKAQIKQFELIDNGRGRISAKKPVREMRLGSTVEGMVADDEHGKLYVAEESVGIWNFDAEPQDRTEGTKIAAVGENGLSADVEGLAMYYLPDGGGYLIASSQGNSTFTVYERQSPHRFLGVFKLDGVTQTDGIDVINLSFNARFPAGVFASHNGRREPYPVQVTKWDEIARTLNLRVDTRYWDPRRLNPGKGPRVVARASIASPPPSVIAALVAAGKVDDDEGRFRVQATCSGTVSAGVTSSAELNGIPVANGQVVKLELDDKTKVKKKADKLQKLKAPVFHLVVACRDSAGNVTTASATPGLREK